MRASGAQALGSGTAMDQLTPALTRFIYGFTHDWHATEDLVQETFLRVIRNLHRYRGQSSFKTWVFSIARNLSLDYLRSSGRSRLRLLDSLESAETDFYPEPGREVERDERRSQVGQALSGLSPSAREFLILREYQGLSYREIAARRGIKPSGVGIRISRALRGLSRRLTSRDR